MLVSNSLLTTLEGVSQINDYFPVTYLLALAQQICDTKKGFLLQQLATLMAAIPRFWKFFILSGVSFVENTFTGDKTELSYTYFFGALPWMFDAAACSIFFLSF